MDLNSLASKRLCNADHRTAVERKASRRVDLYSHSVESHRKREERPDRHSLGKVMYDVRRCGLDQQRTKWTGNGKAMLAPEKDKQSGEMLCPGFAWPRLNSTAREVFAPHRPGIEKNRHELIRKCSALHRKRRKAPCSAPEAKEKISYAQEKNSPAMERLRMQRTDRDKNRVDMLRKALELRRHATHRI